MTRITAMDEFTFEVPGEPVAKARARVTRRGVYTPKKTADWEQLCNHMAQDALENVENDYDVFILYSGPLSVRVTALFTPPASWPQWKKDAALNGRVRHTSKPDGDNILKAVKDACNGIVWHDDSQIVTASIAKDYSTNPRVIISVVPISASPCQIKKREELAA